MLKLGVSEKNFLKSEPLLPSASEESDLRCTIDEFLADFPSVIKDQVIEVMEYIRKQIASVA